ncbi:hypothetical protein FACS1894170_07420 [Planctomycetales bacterium]|nr:hypothetical protein FACS1894170_07420 [Planctomycetales bacterium]
MEAERLAAEAKKAAAKQTETPQEKPTATIGYDKKKKTGKFYAKPLSTESLQEPATHTQPTEHLRRMIARQIKIAKQHCADYPLMEKARTVNIKLSLLPQAQIVDNELDYSKAVLTASAGSPALPTTSVDFNCAVTNGDPFFNIESPDNPYQLTFRDTMDDEADYAPIGKTAAYKD